MPCTPAVKGKASRRRYLAVQWCVWRSSTGLPTGRYGTFSGLARDDITLFLLWLLSLYSNSFFPSPLFTLITLPLLSFLIFLSPFFPCPLFALRFLYSIHVLYSIPLLCFLSLHSILPLPYLLILSYFFSVYFLFALRPLLITLSGRRSPLRRPRQVPAARPAFCSISTAIISNFSAI